MWNAKLVGTSPGRSRAFDQVTSEHIDLALHRKYLTSEEGKPMLMPYTEVDIGNSL
jgi:hypothetical protein